MRSIIHQMPKQKNTSGATFRMEFKWNRRIDGIAEGKKEAQNLCHTRIYFCVDRSTQSWEAIRLHAWTDKLIRVYFHLDFFSLLLLCLRYCVLFFRRSSAAWVQFRVLLLHTSEARCISRMKRRGWRLCYTRAIAPCIQLIWPNILHTKKGDQMECSIDLSRDFETKDSTNKIHTQFFITLTRHMPCGWTWVFFSYIFFSSVFFSVGFFFALCLRCIFSLASGYLRAAPIFIIIRLTHENVIVDSKTTSSCSYQRHQKK